MWNPFRRKKAVAETRHRLTGHCAYLAGPMDQVNDRGQVWREDISEFLWKLGIGVLNPCDNPVVGSLQEDDCYFEEMASLKEAGDWEEVERLGKRVVRSDLHLIDIGNFCIVYIDTTVHSSGTNTELTYAALEKKPVILVCRQGKKGVPNFLWGIGLNHHMFFDNFEQAKGYILTLVRAKTLPDKPDFKDWRFINYDKVFNRGDTTT